MYPIGGFSHYFPDSVVAVSNVKGTKPRSHLIHHQTRGNWINISSQDEDDMILEHQQRAMLDKLNGNPGVLLSSSSAISQPICPLLETQM